MHANSRIRLLRVSIAALLLLGVASACGGDDDGNDTGELSGTIRADGSSTVGPFTTYAAEQFGRENPGVRVTVGISGTGGGFERFCAGETDLSNASRAIDDEEKELCEEQGIDFVEFHVVNDGLAAVVNPDNDWADCLTIKELNAIWRPDSEVENWSQVRDGFPDVELELAGPGTDSGTFDYFTDAVNGEEGASRSDYTASEDDNVIVRAISGERGGLGYFGLSYVEQNEGAVKAVPIENEQGDCVEPDVETVQDGSYNPLSRPLFIYAKRESFGRPAVQAFVEYMLENNQEIAEGALFVPLTEEQLSKARSDLETAVSEAGAAS